MSLVERISILPRSVDFYGFGVWVHNPVFANAVRLVELLLVKDIEVTRGWGDHLHHQIRSACDLLISDSVGAIG